jgi:ABC-type phosphate transport system ATPase subunit
MLKLYRKLRGKTTPSADECLPTKVTVERHWHEQKCLCIVTCATSSFGQRLTAQLVQCIAATSCILLIDDDANALDACRASINSSR